MVKKSNRRYRKKKPTVRKMVKNEMYKMIETKMLADDMDASWSSVGSTWVERNITREVGEGVLEGQRVGRSITITSLEMHGVIVGADDRNVMRIVVGLYSGNSLAPLADATQNLNSPIRNKLTLNLSKKYYDRYIPLDVNSYDGSNTYYKQVKFNYYKRWKNGLRITYTDDSDDYPDKSLVISMISDSGAVANPGFIAGYYIFHWKDA